MTVRILAGIFILILAVSTSGGAKQPISIGVSLALSGKYAARVTMQKKGFSLWQSQINAKGGNGKNL